MLSVGENPATNTQVLAEDASLGKNCFYFFALAKITIAIIER